jgi:sulfoquinovosidase
VSGPSAAAGGWSSGRRRLATALIAASAPGWAWAGPAAATEVDAGSLRADSDGSDLTFTQPGSPGSTLQLAGTAPAGLTPELTRVGEGMIRVRFEAPTGTLATRAKFVRPDGELFLGFGERSDAVVRSSGRVEHRVTEGPFQDVEDPFIAAFVPLAGYSTRDDATYFPLPWLISTRGYGVLIENDAQSRNRLGSPWSAEVDGRRLSLLVVAGPTPREVLQRFSAHVGRQPPVMRPAFGPWWQRAGGTAADEEWLETLRSKGALGSIGQTYTHYLPCADQVGRRERERERTALYRDAGLLTSTYFNPMICTSHPRYDEAAANGWLTKNAAGEPYVYRYTGSTVFLVSQIDFRAPGAIAFYRSLTDEAFEDGHVGWMEDFGEYTPDDAVAHDGTTGTAGHNAYARDYHLGVHRATGENRWIRFVRSGWTGSAAGSPVVWNGDPTTGWEFDGLESAVRNGLSMGLSGVSRWGSDIGGFFALSEPQTTPELLSRWIELGFASGIMRTQGNGFGLGEASGTRAQIIDPEVLPVWARYAKLRTRLLPEITRAERVYRRTGVPIMRHLALTDPGDPEAIGREDQYMFGDSILVAPVVRPEQTERRLYLPKGRWVDLWRSADSRLRKIRRPKVIGGGREITVPAPLEELPMLVRRGAALELLPRGGPSWRQAVKAGAARRSVIAFGGKRIRIRGAEVRRYRVQWTQTKRPRQLRLDGKRVRFTYERGVVRTSLKTRGGVLRAR